MALNKLIAFTLFILMLICLLANPAPVSIESADLFLIALPFCLSLFALKAVNHARFYLPESNLLIATLFYLIYLLFSILLGLQAGVPILGILRSLGPYVNFFPLILLGFLPQRYLNPWVMAGIFILVGAFQALYQLYLYANHSYDHLGTAVVIRNRITLIEPRTTLPIVLSLTVLPLVIFAQHKLIWKIVALACILLGVFAGAVTLTRSIMISIAMGWFAFLLLYIYYQGAQGQSIIKIFQKILFVIILIGLAFICLSMLPKVQLLEESLLARFSYDGKGADYSNGRLYDEWLPALTEWSHANIVNIFFGLGAGNPFNVMSGEERTYIHNLTIYSLVYGGIFGFLSTLWLYLTLFKTLILRAHQAKNTVYLGFAALLVSIYTYAQLFAVHKGLAFNAMLFIMIALALSKHSSEIIKENESCEFG